MKLKIVRNYRDLEMLPKNEQLEVLVESSSFRYRVAGGRWVCVGRGERRESGAG